MDVKVFSSVAGGVGGGLVKLPGGVVCNDCCADIMDSRAAKGLRAGFGQARLDGRLHSYFLLMLDETGGGISSFVVNDIVS
jgi:hypothetical protein